jgi:hypothetical protein
MASRCVTGMILLDLRIVWVQSFYLPSVFRPPDNIVGITLHVTGHFQWHQLQLNSKVGSDTITLLMGKYRVHAFFSHLVRQSLNLLA